jgi:N-acetylmuramoyl-L-alanine amidase
MRREAVRWARRWLLAIILLALVAGGVSTWQAARSGEGPAFLLKLLDSLSPRAARHVGIVAGHSGSDSGAVCRDGLTEAHVNRAIAEAVVSSLRKRGMTVDLLAEFDSRLPGYRADVFVSIHADSCEVELSGYKVASLEDGSKASAQLADCLWNEYGAVTGLSRHPDTVTYDMSRYHAFREIAAQTPAAIIETGFLNADRELLTQHPDRAAQGIVAGIQCFMDQ